MYIKIQKVRVLKSIKIKDEVFDDTVVKLPIDDMGKPFNPNRSIKRIW
jgi:hypothetical protein